VTHALGAVRGTSGLGDVVQSGIEPRAEIGIRGQRRICAKRIERVADTAESANQLIELPIAASARRVAEREVAEVDRSDTAGKSGVGAHGLCFGSGEAHRNSGRAFGSVGCGRSHSFSLPIAPNHENADSRH